MGNITKGKNKAYIKWHHGFVSAMKLELKNHAEHITFHSEYVLNNSPKFIDLIIIKREDIEDREDDLLMQFNRLNVFEYKGVGDELDIDVFSKGIAYACLFKSEQTEIEPRDFEDITLIFVRAAKPVKLLKQLKGKRIVVKHQKGVYTINVTQLFEIRIIVLNEIDFETHPWLSALTGKVDTCKAQKLVLLEKNAMSKWERDNAEVVMDVIIKANKWVFQSAKGGSEYMCEAMWELMQPEINAKIKEVMADKVAELTSLEERIASVEQLLISKEKQLADKDEQLADKDEQLADKDEQLADKDTIIQNMKVELYNIKKQLGMNVS